MKISTQVSVWKQSKVIPTITTSWDKLSGGWREIWGPHIHHGYYEELEQNDFSNNVCDLQAQEKIIDKLAERLAITPQTKILDLGCGLGGSSLRLAEKFQAWVTGVTLSRTQLVLAQKSIPKHLAPQLRFKIDDAHSLNSFSNHCFDVIWSLESAEQFYDKSLFIKQAFRLLKPGGKLMIATWCSNQESFEGNQAKIYLDLCRSFQLPYMPTDLHYKTLITKQGFQLLNSEDWSDYVKSSWERGLRKLRNHSWWKLFSLGGLTGILFIRKLKLISQAFQNGQLRYVIFIAQKPK